MVARIKPCPLLHSQLSSSPVNSLPLTSLLLQPHPDVKVNMISNPSDNNEGNLNPTQHNDSDSDTTYGTTMAPVTPRTAQ